MNNLPRDVAAHQRATGAKPLHGGQSPLQYGFYTAMREANQTGFTDFATATNPA